MIDQIASILSFFRERGDRQTDQVASGKGGKYFFFLDRENRPDEHKAVKSNGRNRNEHEPV